MFILRALAVAALLAACAPTTTVDTAGPSCVYFEGEARYRYPGYDHIVHVYNGCSNVAFCDVSSNVDPQPVRVRLDPSEHKAVLLRRGSPSETFVPRVDCAVGRVSGLTTS